MEWARTITSAANARVELGLSLRSGDQIGKAMALYARALATCTPEQEPSDWARAHNGYTRAAALLGSFEG